MSRYFFRENLDFAGDSILIFTHISTIIIFIFEDRVIFIPTRKKFFVSPPLREVDFHYSGNDFVHL